MTITNRTIRTALPIIASTLCQKFGVQIALEGEEAYTNGKRIVLPALTKTDIDPTVVYGYLLHESGHVRHTTFNVKSKQGHNAVLHHALLNILEDGRIEKKMCDEYAGGYHWIQTLDAHILKKPEAMGSAEDMKAAKEPLALLMSFIYFFTRCNASGLTALYANQLRQTEADVKSRFGEAFTRDFTAVLNDSLTADSTRAQGKIADRLIALMKQFCQDNPNDQPDQQDASGQNEEGNPSGQGGSGSSSDDAQNAEGSEAGESSERDASEAGSASSSSDKGQSDKQKTKGCKAKAQSQADASGEATKENVRAIQSVLDATEEAINDAMKGADASKALASDLSEEAQKPGNPNRLQTNVAPTRFMDGLMKPVLEKCLCDKPDNAKAVKDAGEKISRRLERSLRTKVESLARNHRFHTERGNRLSATRLASFVTGNTKVFTREGEHRDVNTAVHIMIDMSGSMDGNSSLGAKKAAYAFAKACASIKGVNVGVSVFNNAWSVGGKESRRVQTLVKHGERSIKSGLENLTRYSPVGGTPSQDAIMAAQHQLLQVRDVNRRILMFVTDGDVWSAKRLIELMKNTGIESRALFIDAIGLPGFFDREVSARSTMDDDELAKLILDLMSDAVFH